MRASGSRIELCNGGTSIPNIACVGPDRVCRQSKNAHGPRAKRHQRWPPRRGDQVRIQFPEGGSLKLIFAGVALLLFLGVVFMMTTGSGGVGLVDVSTTEAAVIVNYLTGKKTVRVEAGYQIVIPYIESQQE